MISQLDRLLRPLQNRISNMLARAVVSLVNDSKKMQLLQLNVLEGETREEIERFQDYGFTSVPLPDSEAVVLFIGGRRDHGVAIAVDDRRYRLKDLQPGEVALYHKDGAKVHLKANGSIEITAKPGSDIVLNGGTFPVARATTDTAGPYPIVGGNSTIKA